MLYDRGALERMIATGNKGQLADVLLQRERAVIGDTEP
jgi:hypothetical protein